MVVADSISAVGVTNFIIALTALISAIGSIIGLLMHVSQHGPQETTITHVAAPAPEQKTDP
jgi:hypothetical protein